MNFQDFIASGKVRKGSPDLQMARSLVRMSDNHRETISSVPCTATSASTIMTNFYEALREIVEAIAIQDGYKVYSHEAFTYYLKELGEDRIAEKFDRFRKIRNRINYYGKLIDAPSAQAHSKEISQIILELKKKHLKSVIEESGSGSE